MAKAASRSTTGSKTPKSRTRTRGASKSAPAARLLNGGTRSNAIALLKADHREVEQMFESFEKARGEDRKKSLATRICSALRVHAQIEEEIFYPAFFEATREEDLHNEAIIEHDGVKKLISEIESSGPEDDFFDARVKVLSEMVKHHVNEEEQRDGLFSKARDSDMDLAEIGEQLATRKAQLESQSGLMKTVKKLKDSGKGIVTRALTEM